MQTMVQRRIEKISSDGYEATPGSANDWKKNGATTNTFLRFGGVICFLALYVVVISASGKSTQAEEESLAAPSSSSSLKAAVLEKGTKQLKTKDSKEPAAREITFCEEYSAFEKAFEKYDNCVVSYNPPPPKESWETKPIWLPAFPGSGTTGPVKDGDIMKPIINAITGLRAGAKFYHHSGKNLRRCKGADETAACATGHPVIPISPQKQSANFHRKVIMVIRNFKTASPSSDSEKGEAYHGNTGQNELDKWRKGRDMWTPGSFDNWKGLVTAWKNMTEYDIAMYVQYESMFDPERGPAIVQRMADLFKEAGFPVAPNEDIPCMWFQAIKPEYERLQEYWKYNPGFTEEQRDLIVKGLDTFQKEVTDDTELTAILKEYIDDVRTNTQIDIPFPGEGE